MGFASPLGNLKGFATSRPPLMIFTICLTAFALTTLSLAYFIRNSERIPNSDVRWDWIMFLKHLSSFELCVLPDTIGNNTRPVDDEQSESFGNVSIVVSASLSLVTSLPHNITTVTGILPVGAWSSMCKTETTLGDVLGLNVSLSLPQNLTQDDDVCVTFIGPRSLLPVVSTSPVCTPSVITQQGTSGKMIGRSRDAETLGERDDDWCKGGTVMRMVYRSNPHLTVLLTGNDRSLINLHLIHTSYFLFVMAMTLVCYALIKGKPKQKTIFVDKVPLDP